MVREARTARTAALRRSASARQLLATYLVVESKQGLLLVDQHAAHERVLFERLREGWRGAGDREPAAARPPHARARRPVGRPARGAGRRSQALGFDLEPFGESSVVVRAVPAVLAGRDPAALVRGLLDSWLEVEAQGQAARAGSR